MVSIRQAVARAKAGAWLRDAAAFTLIELLAVMTIILILAGLILSIAGNANYKAATSRAQGEIQAMSTALESYKTDNGAYPSSTPTGTDSLDPTASPSVDPGASYPNAYQKAGETLFQALAGVDSSGNFTSKAYYPYTVSQIASTSGALATPPVTSTVLLTTYFMDPFGFAYGYSTDYASELQTAAASGGPVPNPPNGYNPTFDLWCTAGYSKSGGKTYPTNVAVPSTLWVKNW